MKFNLENLPAITNPSFYPLYKNKDEYLILYGGGDSGKSWFAADKLTVRTLLAAQRQYKHKWLVTRKTQPAVKKSAFDLTWKSWNKFGLKPPYAKQVSNPMTLSNRWGTEYIFTGMDDHEKIKSIEGITGIWCEEATELSQKDFWQLSIRLRGQLPDYPQMILSFNPVDEESWIVDEFFKFENRRIEVVTPPDWPSGTTRIRIITEVDGKDEYEHATLHHSTYKNNKFATKADIRRLESFKNKDANFYRVYCLGLWGVVKGLVFDKFEIVKDMPEKFEYHGYGLDFGYSNDPTGLVECGIIGEDVYFREHIYEKKLTNQDICGRMRSLGLDQADRYSADCAEPKSIEEIYRDGWNVRGCKKGKDSIKHGIQRMKQFNIHIIEDSVNMIKEFKTYKWAEDKEGKLLKNPVDVYNHTIDPARYILTDLVGMGTAKVEFWDGESEDKEERKEVMNAKDYDPLTDDVLWEDAEDFEEF